MNISLLKIQKLPHCKTIGNSCQVYNIKWASSRENLSAKASFKPGFLATETSYKIEISSVASLHMILSKKRITKALTRLRRCAGWSVPVLFAEPRRQVISHCGPNDL